MINAIFRGRSTYLLLGKSTYDNGLFAAICSGKSIRIQRLPKIKGKNCTTRQPQLQNLSPLRDSYINEGKRAKPPGGHVFQPIGTTLVEGHKRTICTKFF